MDSSRGDTILRPEVVLKDRYVVKSNITSSHVSRMYRGKDLETNREVAIKELLVEGFINPTEREQAIEQFQFEAKLLLRLVHQNLPKFEDYFEYGGKRYLIMEFVRGENLKDIIGKTDGFLDETQLFRWALELCDVMQYLHTRKPKPIIFRNLSPKNVILSKDGKLKLIDFGLSKLFDLEARTLAVAKTAKMYFSPMEQYTTKTDERTDIYSLGATLYFLITKVPPIDAIDRTLNNVPLYSCRKFNPQANLDFEKILFKAMELNPDNRYYDIPAMRAEIEQIKTVKTEEEPETLEVEFQESEEDDIISGEELEEIEEQEEVLQDSLSLFDRFINMIISFLEGLKSRNSKK